MTMRLYGTADIAHKLHVSKSMISNWLTRYDDTPEPFAQVYHGRFGDLFYWDTEGVEQWRIWAARHFTKAGAR